jgi:HSP20 family protein
MNNLKLNRNELLTDLSRNFDRFLSSIDDFTIFSNSDLTTNKWIPKIDVKELDNQYKIYADVPGIDPNAIEVNVENGILTIKGNVESEQKEDKNNYLRVERTMGSFIRQMSLPGSIDEKNIKAKSKNGVLEINLPKTEKSAAQRIPVEIVD